MEHLRDAGGLNPVLRELRSELRLDAPTVSGRTLGENLEVGGPLALVETGDRPRPTWGRSAATFASFSTP